VDSFYWIDQIFTRRPLEPARGHVTHILKFGPPSYLWNGECYRYFKFGTRGWIVATILAIQ